MALEVALANRSLDKYNPYSNLVEFPGSAAVWQSLISNQTQPVCPTGLGRQGDDISIVRGHMDAYLAYAHSRTADMREFNKDPEFFAFPTYITDKNDAFYLLADTYDNALMIIYLLARADDESTNLPLAACYLSAAVDVARTFMRRMHEAGYDSSLFTPQLRLGLKYEGLFARYPLSASNDAPGDLGSNACALSSVCEA